MTTGGLIVVTAVMVTGCFSPGGSSSRAYALPRDTPPDQAYQVRNQGYALLYDLVSSEKDLAKLLLIKRESAAINALIKDIAATAEGIQRQLDLFALEDPRLNLRLIDLPFIENKTRESIGAARAKQLLVSGGKKFELRLLLTQNEALTYGTHLAQTLAANESIPKRKTYLDQAAGRLRALAERVEDAILAR